MVLYCDFDCYTSDVRVRTDGFNNTVCIISKLFVFNVLEFDDFEGKAKMCHIISGEIR